MRKLLSDKQQVGKRREGGSRRWKQEGVGLLGDNKCGACLGIYVNSEIAITDTLTCLCFHLSW